MLRSAVRRRSLVAYSDDALAREAAAGGLEAFGELYRRHATMAWGVAQAIVRNPDDASDAVAEAFTKVLKAVVGTRDEGGEALRFRPYLLTATRHSAIDVVRRRARMEPAEAIAETFLPSGPGQPVERVVAREEEAIVVQAFGRLPERWRTALWLIDVEQLSTRDAAAVLGVEPNNAAQLAARGRARLREHFLQAHVPNHIRPICQEVVGSLGSYLAGTASTTRRAGVDAHLAVCAECAERLDHVRDLGITLRRAILPLPLLLDRRISRAVSEALESASSLVEPAASAVTVGRMPFEAWTTLTEHLSVASPAVERLIAGVTTAAFVIGVSTAAVKTQDGANDLQDTGAVSAGSQGSGTEFSQPIFPVSVSASTGTSGPAGSPVSGAAAVPGARAAAAGSTVEGLAATGATAATADSPGLLALGGESLLPPASEFVGPTLRGVSLAGADLSHIVVRGMDLTGANLGGATMTGADLSRTLLTAADLTWADVAGAVLRGTNLSRAALPAANLTGADLTQAVAQGANLTGADLTRAVLAGTDLQGADLRSVNLTGADLSGANLSGANLAGAELTSAKVDGLKLADANLVGTVLTGTGLGQAGGAPPAPASLLPSVPQLPVSVPTSLPTAAAPLDGPLGGPSMLPGATGPGIESIPSPMPLADPQPLSPSAGLAGPLSAAPPVGSAVQGPSTPVPAPLVGGPLLPGLGGILTNSPLSPVLG